MARLPNLIFIHETTENDGTHYLIASRNIQEAMEDADQERPRVLGLYKLVSQDKAVKQSRWIPKIPRLRRKK